MPGEVQYGSIPFTEAIDHFRAKRPELTQYWDEMMGAAHAKAFTVAGATKMELLLDLRQAVDDAIANGTSITEFRKQFDEAVAKHGWSHNGKRGWRTRVIYDTNLRTAHAAGAWQQAQRAKESRPYLQYMTAGDSRVRPQHAAWDEKVFPIDAQWWNTHYPPNGWGCRCTTRTLSQRQMEREGLTTSKPPPLEPTERINVKSGEVYGPVPKGIDPGWDYNVGKEWLRWDRGALLPDCGGGIDFAGGDGKACIPVVPGQKTWKDYGRPDMRHIPPQYRIAAPDLLPQANTVDEAVAILRAALGMTTDLKVIRTPANETVVFEELWLPHMVEKRQDARERYSNFILPTLLTPYEVYASEYTDGIRTRYIGAFTGKNDLLVVVRRNQDGSVLYNIMHGDDRRMNKLREGELIYKVGE